MLDAVLDELAATLGEVRATIRELGIRVGKAYEAFRERLGHALYRLGYRLQGEEYEPPDDWD